MTLYVLAGWLCVTIITAGVTFVESLNCWSCVTDGRDSDCAGNGTLTNITLCALNQPYCTVVDQTGVGTNRNFYRLTRGCNKTCAYAGCGIWGEGDEEHMLCRTCCQEDLCNEGNTASSINSNFWMTISPILLTLTSILKELICCQ